MLKLSKLSVVLCLTLISTNYSLAVEGHENQYESNSLKRKGATDQPANQKKKRRPKSDKKAQDIFTIDFAVSIFEYLSLQDAINFCLTN